MISFLQARRRVMSGGFMDTSLLWHYTFGHLFQKIVADQAIVPSAAYTHRKATPVVWFSRNQVWESAALKSLTTDDGQVQALTLEEFRQHGGGLYRIGVERGTAPNNWDAFVQKSEVSRDTVLELRHLAKGKGASLKDWFASFEPVPQSKWLAVEILDNHQWIPTLYGQPLGFTSA
jgi:hypothetical protein